MVITAWMYFIFTLLLALQHMYYTHFATPAKKVGWGRWWHVSVKNKAQADPPGHTTSVCKG
jgi:hypothetical protein